MSSSLRPHGLYSPWNSPSQNTGVGSLSLLQGIFPAQESNAGYSAVQVDSLPTGPLGQTHPSWWLHQSTRPSSVGASLTSAPLQRSSCVDCLMAVLTCVKGYVIAGLTCASLASAMLSVSRVSVGHSAWSLSFYSCLSVSGTCHVMPIS